MVLKRMYCSVDVLRLSLDYFLSTLDHVVPMGQKSERRAPKTLNSVGRTNRSFEAV